MFRYQPPAYSPIDLNAVAAAFMAALVPGRSVAEPARVAKYMRERFRATDVLLTDSGTSALRLAIAGAALARPKSPTALPAYGCYDLATAADGAQVPVVLYDVDPGTLSPRPDSLTRALGRGVSAVVVAHLFGHPVDVVAVQAMAEEQGALVIEDAAQGLGGRLGNADLGTLGSLSVISLGRGKGWTGGAGGALVAHDDRGTAMLQWAQGLLDRSGRGLVDLARLSLQAVFSHPRLYALPAVLPFLHLGQTVYQAPRRARRPSASSMAAAARTFHLLHHEIEVRRTNGRRLLEAARGGGRAQPVREPEGGEPGFLRLPVLCREEARAALPSVARFGIAPGYPAALCDLPGFGGRVVNRKSDFPGARELAARLVTLPTHSRLGERDLAFLERWLQAD